MDNDLFIRLQNYRPREGRNPFEDFITEIFAYLCRNDEEFFNEIVKLFELQTIFGSTNFDSTNLMNYRSIETQVNYGENGRPDIEIKLKNDEKVIIEVKVDSRQNIGKTIIEEGSDIELKSLNQLEKYLKISKKLIYLTKHFEETGFNKKEKNFKHIYWSEIYEITKQHEETEIREELRLIYKNFILLLETNNMTPYTEITEDDIKGFDKTKSNIYKLFDKLIDDITFIEIKPFITTTLKNYKDNTFSIEKKFQVNDIIMTLFFNEEGIYIYLNGRNFIKNKAFKDKLEKSNFFRDGDFYNYLLSDFKGGVKYEAISKSLGKIIKKII